MWQYPVPRLSPLKDANLPRFSPFKKSDLKKRATLSPSPTPPTHTSQGRVSPPRTDFPRRRAHPSAPPAPAPRPFPFARHAPRAPGPRAAGRGRRRLITNATCPANREQRVCRLGAPGHACAGGHTPPGRSRPGLQAASRARASHPSRHKAPCGAGPAREGDGRRPSSSTAEDRRARRDQPASNSEGCKLGLPWERQL